MKSKIYAWRPSCPVELPCPCTSPGLQQLHRPLPNRSAPVQAAAHWGNVSRWVPRNNTSSLTKQWLWNSQIHSTCSLFGCLYLHGLSQDKRCQAKPHNKKDFDSKVPACIQNGSLQLSMLNGTTKRWHLEETDDLVITLTRFLTSSHVPAHRCDCQNQALGLGLTLVTVVSNARVWCVHPVPQT